MDVFSKAQRKGVHLEEAREGLLLRFRPKRQRVISLQETFQILWFGVFIGEKLFVDGRIFINWTRRSIRQLKPFV